MLGRKRPCSCWCFFDIDGVLVYECGVAYSGYWLQLDALRTGNISDDYFRFLEISDKVKTEIDALRPRIKGLHFNEKIRKLSAYLAELGELSPKATNLDISRLTSAIMEVQRVYIQHHFPPDKYCVPGAKELLNRLGLDFHLCTLTANDPEQASWILQYVGLSQYFDQILAYRLDAPDLHTKVNLLRDFGIKHPEVDFSHCVVIGDGVPDIQAGLALGCFTVGVCAQASDREKLSEANLLVTVGQYSEIPNQLSVLGIPLQGEKSPFVLRQRQQICNLDDNCTVEFLYQQEDAPSAISASVIWDIANNTIEIPLASSPQESKDSPGRIYVVTIPLKDAQRNTVTNVGAILLRNGPTVMHKQLFSIAYVGESTTALYAL